MKRPGRPSKKTFLQFLKFNFGGVMFFVVGYVVFVILYGLLHWDWLLAKIVADGLGWITNYAIQYFWAFREETLGHNKHKVTIKFTAVSVMNLAIDYAIVALLKWVGVSPFVGLIVAANFFTAWKWVWYKYYVFAQKHHIPKPE